MVVELEGMVDGLAATVVVWWAWPWSEGQPGSSVAS